MMEYLTGIDKRIYEERKKKYIETRKKVKKYFLYALGVLAFIALIVWWGMQPPYLTGSIRYGICSVFMELYVQYPDTYEVTSMDNYENRETVYFKHVDGFGQTHLDFGHCFFEKDNTIQKISINNKIEIPEEKVAAFNKTIPTIIQNPPPLTVRIYPDLFRNIQFQEVQIDL